jgi:tetratricopeptide (TPR) repeat protein
MNSPHVTWTNILLLIAGTGAACFGLIKLFFETTITERVKSAFAGELEEHKAALDLLKQRALKDFGLFAEKKHEVNTSVYSALRSTYKAVNIAKRGGFSPIRVELLTADDFEQLLLSFGLTVDDRRDLEQIYGMSPEIAASEFNRRLPIYRVKQAEQSLIDAVELTYTSELFLTPATISACDSVIALLTEALATKFGDPKVDLALNEVPKELWKVKSAMRVDLLGDQAPTDEPLITHEEDPRGPILSGLPLSITLDAGMEATLARLISRRAAPSSPPQAPRSIDLDAQQNELSTATEMIAAVPHDVEARINRGRLLLSLQRFKEAESDASAVLENKPENLDALLILAESRFAQQPFQVTIGSNPFPLLTDVITPLDRYLASRPNDVKALRMRGHATFLSGLDYGIADWEAVTALKPDDAISHAFLGEVYRRKQDIARAIDETDRALSLSPTNLLAQSTRLEILHGLHRWKEIVNLCPQIFQMAPKHARAINLFVTSLNVLGRSTDVVAFASRFEVDDPARWSLLGGLARAEFDRGQLESALGHANEAIAYRAIPLGTPESAELVRVLRTTQKTRQP